MTRPTIEAVVSALALQSTSLCDTFVQEFNQEISREEFAASLARHEFGSEIGGQETWLAISEERREFYRGMADKAIFFLQGKHAITKRDGDEPYGVKFV